ncbi:hypothetical protein CWE09_11850 [Aliidiomarina minuta]|uniref:Uncharacterized protein n=1 Tax=Aliidiomarina minuta TaxID=880057 RepID=A0A432W3D6_9GAMM|nr:HAD-IA family hydrolase [Aliidiomarina minuta]RUO23841.1 hypothetical protein CWE09_11850 [Aliidiomarina minuta]
MQFHRRLRPFNVISFDLDDTLYDNGPVLHKAEQALAHYLSEQWPDSADLTVDCWRQIRMQLAKQNPQLMMNMTRLREESLRQGLSSRGVPQSALSNAVADAMVYFLDVRNDIQVPPENLSLLQRCAEKYPLIAITNGNADIQRIGLQDYFVAAWTPGETLRGKPTADMFLAAQQQLNFEAHQLLHIGDHPISDIQGAAAFGAQSVWLNESGQPAPPAALTWLPTLTISSLRQLDALL